MKLYNERLGKIIEGTPMMAKLLSAKGWVEVYAEQPNMPEPKVIHPEVIEVTVDEGEVTASHIESDKPYSYEDIKEDFNDNNKPKADPVKKVKAKSKNKK